VSSVLATTSWRLARRVPIDDEWRPAATRLQRAFGWIVVGSWAAVIVTAVLLGLTGHAAAVAATVCAGIGLHFFPLARLFRVPAYYVTGAALCLLAVATFALAAATSDAALWTLIPGVGAAVVLYATCVALLAESKRISSAAVASPRDSGTNGIG